MIVRYYVFVFVCLIASSNAVTLLFNDNSSLFYSLDLRLDAARVFSPEKMLPLNITNCPNSPGYCVFAGIGHSLHATVTARTATLAAHIPSVHVVSTEKEKLRFATRYEEGEAHRFAWKNKADIELSENKISRGRMMSGSQLLYFGGVFGERVDLKVFLFGGNTNATTRLSVSLKPYCPFGHQPRVYNHSTGFKTCECFDWNEVQSHDKGKGSDLQGKIFFCSWNGEILRSSAFWVGLVDVENVSTSVATLCPPSYCRSCTGSLEENGCLLDVRSLGKQCAGGRKGRLCGECAEGYAPGIGNVYPQCFLQNKKCISLYLWFIITIAVSLIFVIIAVFVQLDVTAGYLPPLVFFYQACGFVLSSSSRSRIPAGNRDAQTAFEILNMYVPIHKCVEFQLPPMWRVAFLYFMPLSVFVFMVVFAVAARIFARVARISVLRPFWSLVTLTYVNITYTTFVLLLCIPLPATGSDRSWYWYHNATIKCYESANHANHTLPAAHWPFEIFGYCILCFYVIPLPLFVAFGMKRISRIHALTDVTVAAFRAKFYWAEGFNFGRRLAVVFTYSIIPLVGSSMGYSLILLLLFSVLTIHTLVKPYRSRRVNEMETFTLFLLSAVAAFQVPSSFPSHPHVASYITAVFLAIPFIFGFFYLIYWLWRKLRSCYHKAVPKRDDSDENSNYHSPQSGVESFENDTELTESSSLHPPSGVINVRGRLRTKNSSLSRTTSGGSYDNDNLMDERRAGIRDSLLETATEM